jgi:MFS family permease
MHGKSANATADLGVQATATEFSISFIFAMPTTARADITAPQLPKAAGKMTAILPPLLTLLFGTAIMMVGHGLLTTLVPVRVDLLGASPRVVGAIAAGYFIGLIFGALYNPRIIHRVGRIRALAGFAAIFAATTLLLPLAPWPSAWIVIRALAGACLAGLTLVIESWLNTVAGTAHRGRVLAIYMIVFYSAFGGGQFLLSAYDPAGFELFAIAAILLGMSLVPIVLTRTEAPEVTATTPLNIAELLRVSPMAVFGSIAAGIILGSFYGLAPLFAVSRGMEVNAVASFMAAAIFGGLALQWPLGLLSDHIDRRSVILGAAIATGGVSAAIAFMPEGADLPLLALVALFGGVSFTIYPLSLAHAADRLQHHEDMVGLSSGMLLLYSMGAVIGPLAAGQVFAIQRGGGMFLFIGAIAFATVIFGLWRMASAPPTESEDQLAFVAVPRTSPALAALDPRQEEEEPELDLEDMPKLDG